jgi:hypothetical protein
LPLAGFSNHKFLRKGKMFIARVWNDKFRYPIPSETKFETKTKAEKYCKKRRAENLKITTEIEETK